MSTKKQSSQLTQFTRMVNFCKAIPNTTTLNELNQRLESTKQLFEDFKLNQDQIEEVCGDEHMEHQYTIRVRQRITSIFVHQD